MTSRRHSRSIPGRLAGDSDRTAAVNPRLSNGHQNACVSCGGAMPTCLLAEAGRADSFSLSETEETDQSDASNSNRPPNPKHVDVERGCCQHSRKIHGRGNRKAHMAASQAQLPNDRADGKWIEEEKGPDREGTDFGTQQQRCGERRKACYDYRGAPTYHRPSASSSSSFAATQLSPSGPNSFFQNGARDLR